MKRKIIIGFSALLLLLCGFILFQYLSLPNGNSIQSREKLLEDKSDGTTWNIEIEQEFQKYILCGIYDNKARAGIAIFEPTLRGYKLNSKCWGSSSDEIITTQFIIDSKLYDIVWFNEPNAEYVELNYSYGNGEQMTRQFQIDDREIICNPAPSNEYNLEVVYYDDNGKSYTNAALN